MDPRHPGGPRSRARLLNSGCQHSSYRPAAPPVLCKARYRACADLSSPIQAAPVGMATGDSQLGPFLTWACARPAPLLLDWSLFRPLANTVLNVCSCWSNAGDPLDLIPGTLRLQLPDRAPLRRYGSYSSPAARRALSEVADTGVAQRSVPTSRVTFRVQYHVPYGQNIRVIGSHPVLGAGDWKPSLAVPAPRLDSASPYHSLLQACCVARSLSAACGQPLRPGADASPPAACLPLLRRVK